jgi:hypothetical protein
MTEDEEFRAALEESKRDADKATKAKQLQQQQQWSSVAKPATSTSITIASNGHNTSATVVKPKATAAASNGPSFPKVASALPARSPTNPWATNPTVPLKPTDPSPPPPATSITCSPISTTSNGTTSTADASDDEETSSEEMFIVPIATRPSAILPTPVKPIARPINTEHSFTSNDIHNSIVSSVLDADISIPISKSQNSITDHQSSSPISSNTQVSDTSSIVSFYGTNTNTMIIQLQETLQNALTRISKLEQTNELLMTRMTRIVEASVHLEQSVSSTMAENNALKAQVTEIRTQMLLAQSPISNPSNDPTAAFLASQGGYATFFQAQPYGNPQRMQPPGQPIGSSPFSLGTPNGSYNPTSISHGQSASIISTPHPGQQGINSAAFAANGFLN